MKMFILLVAFLFSYLSHARTCKASLHGKLKDQKFSYAETKVYYPDDFLKSRPAKWQGDVVAKKFISPEPIEIECGKPFFIGHFGKFRATGMLPERIETFPWTTMDWSGKPRDLEATTLWGFGDSYDYPYPATFLEGAEGDPIFIEQPAPMGVKDICDVLKLPLTLPVKKFVTIQPDQYQDYYVTPSEWGMYKYKWDSFSTPTGETVELELENPYINITCEAQWKYEATFTWPYVIPNDDPSLCGPGEVHREMKLEGDLLMTEDNKVWGYISVKKPTVEYNGNVTASYSGEGFTFPIEGKYTQTDDGKKQLLLPLFEGGDGISWRYTVMCPYGQLSNGLFGAVSHYLKIMMNQEELTADEAEGLFILSPEGDEKTFTVDMGGQGIVTIERKLKKL